MMLHLLTIVLVVLKATSYLDWSWWLVFTPSLVSVFIVLIVASLAIYAGYKS